jgi:nucleoside-diphosphate-sugar epimerase
MATYLVTGIAGFIASRVTQMLLDAGHNVVGIDNLNNAYDVRLKHWRLAQLEGHPQLTVYRGDIADRTALDPVFDQRQYDAVINLAARAGVRTSVANPWVYIETNVTGTLNLLERCRDHQIPKFILASTSSLYGKDNPMPYSEEQPTDGPLSPYAASKKAAEALCHTYHYLNGLDVSILRFFTVYGPAGRPDMSLFRFVQWVSEGRPLTVFGDGSQSRDFTYVDDIARGVIAALRPLGYQVINLGSDEPIVLNDVIHMIEELLGQPAQIERHARHPADVPATWANINKARQLLDWEPQTRFIDGLRNLVEWYRANREWARDVNTDAL